VSSNIRTVTDKHLTRFFDYARERYSILLRRCAGEPAPWTTDPVLSTWRFTNVFREDDKTTTWFREHIRDPLRHFPRVMVATIAFRAFNRIETGELLKPFLLKEDYNLRAWRETLLEYRGPDMLPLVTGAYIIKTPPNMTKLDGVLWIIEQAKLREPQLLQWHWNTGHADRSQRGLWEIIRKFPYMGDFTAAEVACDLIHTDILEDANDLMTWTNPGPGCAAGIGLLLHNNLAAYNRHSEKDRAVMMDVMDVFLQASRRPRYWPEDWPEWNLHTVEFAFCEVSKYLRGLKGLKLKRRYKHGLVDAEPLRH